MDGIDIGAILQALQGTVNLPVMTMLAVLAFALHRANAISSTWAILLPMCVGGVLGVLSAIGHAEQAQGGWIQNAALLQSVIEGAIVNGGGAVLVGRMASIALGKWWPTDGQPEPPST